MFWIVLSGAVASTLVLLYILRKDNQDVDVNGETEVEDYFPTFLLTGMIALLIIASFIEFPQAIDGIKNGLICMILFIIGLLRSFIKAKDAKVIIKAFKEIDYFTILLLAGLFIVISSITEAGVVKDISSIFVMLSGDNLFIIYTLIVWASVLFSAFIDNIPYVATMLTVVQGIAVIMGVDPYILYFGLLTGVTLGGNLTPIGASANITGIGILRKDGYEVTTKQFMKIGVPLTLAAVAAGYILIWLIWA